MTKAELQLIEVLILERVRKLYAIEVKFNSLFKASHGTVGLAFSNKKSFAKVRKSRMSEKTQEAP